MVLRGLSVVRQGICVCENLLSESLNKRKLVLVEEEAGRSVGAAPTPLPLSVFLPLKYTPRHYHTPSRIIFLLYPVWPTSGKYRPNSTTHSSRAPPWDR